jgi:hypothetical protein
MILSAMEVFIWLQIGRLTTPADNLSVIGKGGVWMSE